jgi:hypothetical protein
MLIHCMRLVLFCALPLMAQNFIQMSDPQFGMFTKARTHGLPSRISASETMKPPARGARPRPPRIATAAAAALSSTQSMICVVLHKIKY